jgi:hypothetical protein
MRTLLSSCNYQNFLARYVTEAGIIKKTIRFITYPGKEGTGFAPILYVFTHISKIIAHRWEFSVQ